ncbi:type II toxin-antitoxin system VapC family toxin [Pseudomonas serbica]
MSLKRAKGMLDAPEDLEVLVEDEGFTKLPISLFHGQQAGKLPEIHRDPFDRMLIAQAQVEGLELVTAGGIIPHYAVRVVSARL